MKKAVDGKVISIKMQKTAIVEVVRRTPHPLYKKLIKRSSKFKVDVGKFTPRVGDTVRIEETKPVSKEKYHKIIKILEQGRE